MSISSDVAAGAPGPVDLTGREYTRSLVRRYPARLLPCVICSASSAAGWDHCHRHGMIRGPVCGPCNVALALADAGMVPLQARWGGRAAGTLAAIVAHRKRCRWCPRANRFPRIARGGAYWASRVLDDHWTRARHRLDRPARPSRCHESCRLAQWVCGVELARYGHPYEPAIPGSER